MKALSMAVSGAALLVASTMAFADEGAWSAIEGNWADMQGQVQAQWAELTEDDLMQINGSKDALVATLAEKYGISAEEAAEQVDAWAASVGG